MNRTLAIVLLSASALVGAAPTYAATPTASAAGSPHVTADQQSKIDALTTAYLSIKKRLAADSFDGVADGFKAVHEAADDLSGAADLKAAAEKFAAAAHAAPADLAAAREQLKALSAAVIVLTTLAPPTDAAAKALYVVHCPMAEASWLQTTKKVANPYMGTAMSGCGSVKQTVKAAE